MKEFCLWTPDKKRQSSFTQNKSLVFFFEVGDAFEVLAGVAEAHRGYRFKRQHLRYSALPPAAPGANVVVPVKRLLSFHAGIFT